MCGIFGALRINCDSTFNIDTAIVRNKLGKRGPDGWGEYRDDQIVLCHSRLSIIDLEGGKQPIFNEDKSICIIFNGEIFNYADIRKDLLKTGHRFATNSDTEVIIHAYEEWGDTCVEKFRGMFAFAIWDSKQHRLFIARDRLGIKPLFYTIKNNILYFASEMKAFISFSNINRTIDENALAAYFTLSYIPAPLTIFNNINKLPAGHVLIVENGNVTTRKYWDVYFAPDYSMSEKFFTERFSELFEESIKLRMISDVPIGAFLSGGIDSGLVVAIMSKFSSNPVHTFSMGFGGEVGGYLDERGYARSIAERYLTKHQEFEVLPDVKTIIQQIVSSFDEPFADHSTIPSYYLYKLTGENVKVALSGLGGDELFGGYERYLGFKLSQLYNLLPKFISDNIIKQLIETIPERKDSHYTINHLKRFVRYSSLPQDKRYFGYISTPGDIQSIFADKESFMSGYNKCQQYILDLYNSQNATEPLDKIFYTDIKSYLPEDILACTDRLSMWHSLEARVPFLDHKLLEFCATIPSKYKIKWCEKKYLLKLVAKNYLPEEILTHRKQGFVGPMASWMRHDLKEYIFEVLDNNELNKHGIFDNNKVKLIITNHLEHCENNEKLIWSLIIFQEWYKENIF